MILLGRPVAQKIEDQAILPYSLKNHCHLAVVLVGRNPDSQIYVQEKVKAGQKLGIEVSIYRLAESEKIEKIQERLRHLNDDEDIAGTILQLPLPESLAAEQDQLISLIYQTKDVDSLSKANRRFAKKVDLGPNINFRRRWQKLKELYKKEKIFLPPTAAAIMEILEYHQIDLQSALIIGRGLLVGRPVAKLFDQMAIHYQVIHSQTRDQQKKDWLKKAKVIISGSSAKTPIFRANDISDQAVVIDCTRDFDHNSIKEASGIAYTPAIGGVGPVTVVCLLKNVVLAKKWQK